MATSSRLVLVVVNKSWECDPVIAALLGEAAPPLLRRCWPEVVGWPRPRRNPPRGADPLRPFDPSPRLVYSLDHARVEVWCVSDLLEHLPDEGRYQSSTERKAERLPALLADRAADLVIAVGTAASPVASEGWNGSVVIGTNVFAHDGDPENPASRWRWSFGEIVPSAVTAAEFAALAPPVTAVLPRLLPTPRGEDARRTLIAQHDLVSLGDVNVTDYAKYPTADAAALRAFAAVADGRPAGSMETTHAVIRATLGDRFLFVSGIVNRMGRFDEEVGGPGFNTAQNFAGAYNAGVAVAWILPALDAAWYARAGRPRRSPSPHNEDELR